MCRRHNLTFCSGDQIDTDIRGQTDRTAAEIHREQRQLRLYSFAG